MHASPSTPTTAAMAFDREALSGRVAVVTGGAGGLGLAICAQLHAMGAQVVQVDLQASGQAGERMLPLACDIGEPAAIAALAAEVRTRFGRCDVLVNNAAVTAPRVPLEEFPAEQWDRVFRVNLRGALLCAQALVPMMFEREAGSIVNLASIGAQVPTRSGAYGPTKAALRGLTQQMAVEWGPRGVRSNSVSPGMIRTPLSEPHYAQPQALAIRESHIPARRIGRPGDIAGLVAFLASDASAYLNGEDIVVDGGFLKASLVNLYDSVDAAHAASDAAARG